MGKREMLTLKYRPPAPVERPCDDFVEVAEPAVTAAVAPALVIAITDYVPRNFALERCLDCWSYWMGNCDRDLGIQHQKSLRGDGDGYGNEDTSRARRDNEIAEATDAQINSLRHHHRWAIYRRCGLSTVWNFPSLDRAQATAEAEQQLIEKLKINLATRNLFC